MPTSTLLVFPAGVDGAKEYLRIAEQLGVRTVAASSVPVDLRDTPVSALIHLPFVTDAAFPAKLLETIESHGITHIHAPHHAVWWFLKQWQAEPTTPAFTLCGTHAYAERWNEFTPHLQWAAETARDTLAEDIDGTMPLPAAPAWSALRYASLCRGFLRVPGESDLDKLRALCAIARVLPRGDVVEIGSLYGRSAYALARLAQGYGIGSTICVDPWRNAQVEDQGHAAQGLCGDPVLTDLDRIFMNFCAMACEMPGLSYIRQTSANALQLYRDAATQGTLDAPELASVPIQGEIALLHIDGNHRYDHVVQDIQLWTPFLASGGWLLLDDYVWAFGDGPRRAGDELLDLPGFDMAFVASDTLFLRRTSGHAD